MQIARTSIEGGRYEMSKTYRYTLVAHQEIDVCANNRDDADKKAEKEWTKLFGGKGLFGDAEFIGDVKDE